MVKEEKEVSGSLIHAYLSTWQQDKVQIKMKNSEILIFLYDVRGPKSRPDEIFGA